MASPLGRRIRFSREVTGPDECMFCIHIRNVADLHLCAATQLGIARRILREAHNELCKKRDSFTGTLVIERARVLIELEEAEGHFIV